MVIYSDLIQNWGYRFVRLLARTLFLFTLLITTMNSTSVTRYSDQDLLEFQQLLEAKQAKAENQLASIEKSLADAAESKDREGDWMDDSTTSNDIQMLEAMVVRQRKHLLDLTNALQRIKNKSYGICVITGELIDKRRLLAVPTTTKCIAAKLVGNTSQRVAAIEKPKAAPKKEKRKVLSRIIRKPSAVVKSSEEDLEIEEEDLKDLYAADYEDAEEGIDLDGYSEEDLES